MSFGEDQALLGRDRETRHLARLIGQAQMGGSGVLVLRGETGVGKTALLEQTARLARGDFTVTYITGVESEMELSFAGLHQLCQPILDRMSALPEPQERALRVALGIAPGTAPDRFLVALATLTLMSEAARNRPLLCVVDDAQWVDAASAQALEFVARRLQAESVALLFGVREPSDRTQFAGLPEYLLHGLPDADARRLLQRVIPGRLDEHVRDRLVAETRGIPLALIELPQRLSVSQLPGGYGLLAGQGGTLQVEESFRDVIEGLSPDARLLLLLAAAEPADDPLLLWRAAEHLGIGSPGAAATEAEELLTIGSTVRFRHPLVRSAVYGSAARDDRHRAHLALANATDPDRDADRRAWHLAAAVPSPDDEVADELERSAGRAQARGGVAAAAAFLRRSVALTREPGRRLERTLPAAQASLHAGEYRAALTLLQSAREAPLDELQQARLDVLTGQVLAASGPPSEAAGQLLVAAQRLHDLDPMLARETYLDAWAAALFAGSLSSEADLRDVSTAARSFVGAERPVRAADILLNGLVTLVLDGRTSAAPVLRDAVEAFQHVEIPMDKGLQWTLLCSLAALEVWDFEGCEALIAHRTDAARATGALAPLALTLQAEGVVAVLRGDLEAAARTVVEAEAVTHATRSQVTPFGGLLLLAVRGREAEARTQISEAIEQAVTDGQGLGRQWADYVTAVMLNALGRHGEALDAAARAASPEPQGFSFALVLPELIEAAVHVDQFEIASEALDRLSAAVTGLESDWGTGVLERCRALLAAEADAEQHFRRSIHLLARTALRPELARTHLLYGEWLREQRRREPARESLSVAHSMFTSIGAEAFARRSRHGVLLAGGHARSFGDDGEATLTPQEEQIARLARAGHTNVQIGTELYLSPRTVEWHLKKVFAKLAISSRRELRDALPERGGPT